MFRQCNTKNVGLVPDMANNGCFDMFSIYDKGAEFSKKLAGGEESVPTQAMVIPQGAISSAANASSLYMSIQGKETPSFCFGESLVP